MRIGQNNCLRCDYITTEKIIIQLEQKKFLSFFFLKQNKCIDNFGGKKVSGFNFWKVNTWHDIFFIQVCCNCVCCSTSLSFFPSRVTKQKCVAFTCLLFSCLHVENIIFLVNYSLTSWGDINFVWTLIKCQIANELSKLLEQ